MEALFYNADDGYLEGIVRGYRGSILTNSAYINLTQCETLEGEPSTTRQTVCQGNSMKAWTHSCSLVHAIE